MGWNTGYTIFEETVIGAYDLGVLTPALLCVLMEPYRDTDIDSGGSRDLTAKDGLCVEEIVLSLLAPDQWESLKARRDSDDELELYCDDRYDAFHAITKNRFGWG